MQVSIAKALSLAGRNSGRLYLGISMCLVIVITALVSFLPAVFLANAIGGTGHGSATGNVIHGVMWTIPLWIGMTAVLSYACRRSRTGDAASGHSENGGGNDTRGNTLHGQIMNQMAAMERKAMRTPFICGNWKMYKTVSEAVAFMNEVKGLVANATDVEIGIGAPATALKSLADAAKGTAVQIGGENCFWENEGAFTGEIAPAMLTEAGCSFVIIGHSERRQYFGETNETVNKKVKAALAEGLTVILCCGETLEEREGGKTTAVVSDHVKNGLAGLSKEQMAKVVIAYEPVWAIGTGKTATPEQAQEVHAVIRGLLADMFGKDVAEATRIQYGGSVKPENVKEIMAQPDVDGALVGGASLKPESFAKLVNFKA